MAGIQFHATKSSMTACPVPAPPRPKTDITVYAHLCLSCFAESFTRW